MHAMRSFTDYGWIVCCRVALPAVQPTLGAQMSCFLPPNAARHALAQQQDDNNDDKYQTETAADIHIEPP
jgi:hypothetical protein